MRRSHREGGLDTGESRRKDRKRDREGWPVVMWFKG
jgi:hypothetical protein